MKLSKPTTDTMEYVQIKPTVSSVMEVIDANQKAVFEACAVPGRVMYRYSFPQKAVPINQETLEAEAKYWDMINARVHDRDL